MGRPGRAVLGWDVRPVSVHTRAQGRQAMPRLREAISLAGSAVVGSFSWPLLRRRLALEGGRDGSGYDYAAMDGRREVGRLAYAPGVNPGGDWFWAVRYGASGYAASRKQALAALARAYRAQSVVE